MNAYVYLLFILYMWKYIVYVRVYYMPTNRLCVWRLVNMCGVASNSITTAFQERGFLVLGV